MFYVACRRSRGTRVCVGEKYENNSNILSGDRRRCQLVGRRVAERERERRLWDEKKKSHTCVRGARAQQQIEDRRRRSRRDWREYARKTRMPDATVASDWCPRRVHTEIFARRVHHRGPICSHCVRARARCPFSLSLSTQLPSSTTVVGRDHDGIPITIWYIDTKQFWYVREKRRFLILRRGDIYRSIWVSTTCV